MIVFAIRHKVSGCLLCLGKTRAGTASVLSATKTPRIFVRRGAAVQALDWWAMGRYSAWYTEDGDFRDRSYPAPERVKADMEVVPMLLERTA